MQKQKKKIQNFQQKLNIEIVLPFFIFQNNSVWFQIFPKKREKKKLFGLRYQMSTNYLKKVVLSAALLSKFFFWRGLFPDSTCHLFLLVAIAPKFGPLKNCLLFRKKYFLASKTRSTDTPKAGVSMLDMLINSACVCSQFVKKI